MKKLSLLEMVPLKLILTKIIFLIPVVFLVLFMMLKGVHDHLTVCLKTDHASTYSYIPFEENGSVHESFEDHMIEPVTGHQEPKPKKRKKKDADWCESEDEYTGGLSVKKKKRTSKVKDPKLHLTIRERGEAKNLSEEKIALILKCCDICNPNNQEYQNVITEIPTPKTFDYGAYVF